MSEKRFKLITPLGTRLGLTDIFIKDTQKDYYYNTKEMVVDLLNRLYDENEQLKEEIRAYPINEQYAEEIMQQNQKLRIERNDLRRENEQLKQENNFLKQIREAFQIDVKNSRNGQS